MELELLDVVELLETALEGGDRVPSSELREIVAILRSAQAELERRGEVIETLYEEGLFIEDFSLDDAQDRY
jgi:hypothetical protein